MKKSTKTKFQRMNTVHDGVPTFSMTSSCRQWHHHVQGSLTMPKSQALTLAVARDDRKQPMALSDPLKTGLKPIMDHTR